MLEAVADRLVARHYAVNLAWHQIIAENRHDSTQRTHPAQAFGREAGVAPAHRFRPGKCADDRRNGFRQHIAGRPARLVYHRKPRRTPLDVTQFQLVATDAILTAEAVDCLIRRAFWWTLGFLADRFGLLGQVPGDQGQSSWRRIDGNGAGFQAGFGHLFGEQPFEIGAGLGLHPCGDFFREQFEEEVGHKSSPLAGRWRVRSA